jgi:hypothetical protein
MADTYGMNVYDEDGVLVFSLSTHIIRDVYNCVVSGSAEPFSQEDIVISQNTSNIVLDDLFILQIPLEINKPPRPIGYNFGVAGTIPMMGLYVNSTGASVGIGFSISTVNLTNVVYGDTMVYLIGKS